MKGAAPRRRLHAPLALQIMGLLVAGLLAAQGATLILTLLLPPAPKPQYGLDDIAVALRGGRVPVQNLRPLVRTVRGDPPSLQSAGWLVSEQSHDDLARRLGADPADVRLLFYSPLPFAGAGEGPARALKTASADGRGRRIVMASILPLPQVALPQGGQAQGFPGPGGAQRGGGPVTGAGYPGGGPPGGTTPGGGFPGGTLPGGPFPAQGGGLPAGRGPIIFPGGGATTTGQAAGPTTPPAGGSFPADPDGPIITAPWPRQPTAPLPPTTGPATPPGRPTFPGGGSGGSGGASGHPHGPAGPIGRGPIGRGRIDPGPLTGEVFEPAAPEPEPTPAQPPAPRTRDMQAAPALPPPVRVDAAPAATPAPSLQTSIRPPAVRPAAPPPAPARTGYILPQAPVRGLFGIGPAPFVEGDFVAAWRIGPGRWATVQPAPEPFPNSWQRRVLLWFVVSFALVAPLGWLFARRLAAPLAAFSAAAERLGRDPSGPVLALDGPAEIGRAAGAFNLMQQRLKRYIDDRTAMVGAISHDLRTPLARMRFRIERAPPDMKRGMTEDIVQMEEMIASVLAFIRDASEPSHRERVDLRSIVECVVDDAALVGGDAVLDPGAPASVVVDSLGVQRVVTNLVENALKYGRSAHVRLFTEGGEAVTEVVDAGPGLPEAELERVFLPFYRAQPARTMNKGGIGLGLAVSRSIARAHGGDVTLYNAGEGLVAQLRLPLAAAAA